MLKPAKFRRTYYKRIWGKICIDLQKAAIGEEIIVGDRWLCREK